MTKRNLDYHFVLLQCMQLQNLYVHIFPQETGIETQQFLRAALVAQLSELHNVLLLACWLRSFWTVNGSSQPQRN